MATKIIDVSKHQGTIDWSKVKGHIDGAIIRCGFGDDYNAQDDQMFDKNVKGCIENGIPFGVYIYSYATSQAQAISEAKHVLRLVRPYKDKLSYPIYLDLEEEGTSVGAVERAITFGDIIEAEGYWCGIYANEYWWNTFLKDKLDRFTKWVAKYSTNEPRNISQGYDMWQYTSTAHIDGIDGNVDVSHCYRDLPKYIHKTASKPVTPVTNKKSNEQIALEIIRLDNWGKGEERKRRLTEAGYDANVIQQLVNKMMEV